MRDAVTEVAARGDDDDDRVEELAFACLEAADVDAAVAAACAAHPELAPLLRRMVQRLRSDGFLRDDTPAFGAVPEVLGNYRLARRIGAGGMGVVHVARDLRLQRAVALKLVRPELLWFPGSRERFQREVDAVARLRHPNIVAIHEVGEQDGIPFFAMELVDGVSLGDRLDALRGRPADGLLADDLLAGDLLADDQRGAVGSWVDACLQLAIEAAGALQHAHDAGVVHRDVKPSNVLIDRDGRARLVDFGLARLDDDQELTRTASQVGSLPYMPPEQAAGRLTEHGPRQDVYSLGVTLYEALTLTNPFLVGSVDETRRRVLAATPPPPRRLNRRVSWEVETICLKAMDPDPARRYATMAALRDDLERARAKRPIAARRAGRLLRARRYAQRHPARVIGALAALLLGGVVPTAFAVYQRGVSQELRALAAHAAQRAELASLAGAAAGVEARDAAGAAQALALCPEDRRGYAWHRLARVIDESEQVWQLGTRVDSVAVLGERGLLAAGAGEGEVCILDRDGGIVDRVRLHDGDLVHAVVWDAKRQRGLSAGLDGRLLAWPLDDEGRIARDALVELGRWEPGLQCMALHPAGDLLVAGGLRGAVLRLDLSAAAAALEEVARLPAQGRFRIPVFDLAFAPGGRRLAAACPGGALLFAAPFDGARVRTLPAGEVAPLADDWVHAVEFVDTEGECLAALGPSGVALFDCASGRPLGGRLAVSLRGGFDLAVVRSQGLLAVLGKGGLALRDLDSTAAWLPPISPPRIGHRGEARRLALLPDDGGLLTASVDGSVRRWSVRPPRAELHPPAPPTAAALDPGSGGSRAVASLRDGRFALLDLDALEVRAVSAAAAGAARRVVSLAPGRALGLAESGLQRVTWSDATIATRPWPGPTAADTGAALALRWLTAGGRRAVVLDRDDRAWVTDDVGVDDPVWRPLPATADGAPTALRNVRLGPHGRLLLGATRAHAVVAWDLAAGVYHGELARHRQLVAAFAFATAAPRAFSAGYDGLLRVYDTARLVEVGQPMEQVGATIDALAVTPDGTELVTATVRGELALWQAPARVQLLQLGHHATGVYTAEFAPGARRLVTSSWDGTVRCWDALGR